MDCVASSKEEYVEIATRLGRDGDYARQIGQRIKDASDTVLEDKAAVDELVEFFKRVCSMYKV